MKIEKIASQKYFWKVEAVRKDNLTKTCLYLDPGDGYFYKISMFKILRTKISKISMVNIILKPLLSFFLKKNYWIFILCKYNVIPFSRSLLSFVT